MSRLNELMKRKTVKFKRPLSAEEFEDALRGFGVEANCDVEFDLAARIKYSVPEGQQIIRRRDLSNTWGSCYSRTPSVEFMSMTFELKTGYFGEDDESMYESMGLLTIPGKERVDQLPPGQVAFIDSVREYFCKR